MNEKPSITRTKLEILKNLFWPCRPGSVNDRGEQRLEEADAKAELPFTRDESGIAIVEFALILPIMLMVFLGLVEASRGIAVASTVDHIAHVVADLTGQKLDGGDNPGQAAVNDADLGYVVNAAKAMLAPLSSTSLKIVISEVRISKIAGAYRARVQWSLNWKDNARPCFVNLTPSTASSFNNIAPQFLTNADSTSYVIIADVSYSYSPGVHFKILDWNSPPTWTLQSTSYAPLRNTYAPPHIQYKATKGVSCPAW